MKDNFKAFRSLTFAEKKVNFSSLQKKIVTLSKLLDEKLLELIPNFAQRKDIDKNKEVLVDILTVIQKEAFEVWKKSAATEMKLNPPSTNKAVVWVMKKGNVKIVDSLVDKIYERFEEKGFSEEWIVKQFMNWLKTLFIVWSINLWRDTVFEQNPEQVYAFQYSAILDWATTDLCRSLDWMVVKPDSKERYKYNPPNHWNCRSIWVEILQEEKWKPGFEKKIAEDEKNIMKKYKDNLVDVGMQEVLDEVKEEIDNSEKITLYRWTDTWEAKWYKWSQELDRFTYFWRWVYFTNNKQNALGYWKTRVENTKKDVVIKEIKIRPENFLTIMEKGTDSDFEEYFKSKLSKDSLKDLDKSWSVYEYLIKYTQITMRPTMIIEDYVKEKWLDWVIYNDVQDHSIVNYLIKPEAVEKYVKDMKVEVIK